MWCFKQWKSWAVSFTRRFSDACSRRWSCSRMLPREIHTPLRVWLQLQTLRVAWWALSYFVFWQFFFFCLAEYCECFPSLMLHEISGQPSKSSHIWDARWGLRGWLASRWLLFFFLSLPPSLRPLPPPPFLSIDPMEPWVTGAGGRKILFFLPLCCFWIQDWDRKTRRILKRRDSENTENKYNNVYTKGLKDTVAWIQYLWILSGADNHQETKK